MENHEYDLVVIGSGPAGQKGAICAAKLRKKVAIIDRKRTIGGVCVHTGTIPSKTLREAVLYLSGFRQRTFYGRGYVLKDRISMADLIFRAQAVMAREIEVIAQVATRDRSGFYPDASHEELVEYLKPTASSPNDGIVLAKAREILAQGLIGEVFAFQLSVKFDADDCSSA